MTKKIFNALEKSMQAKLLNAILLAKAKISTGLNKCRMQLSPIIVQMLEMFCVDRC